MDKLTDCGRAVGQGILYPWSATSTENTNKILERYMPQILFPHDFVSDTDHGTIFYPVLRTHTEQNTYIHFFQLKQHDTNTLN